MKSLGEAAIHLPWLSPSSAALVALARAPTASAWENIRTDPGGVLLLLRFALGAPTAPDLPLLPACSHEGAMLEAARAFLLQEAPAFVDWQQPTVSAVYRASLRCAQLAQALAEHTQRTDPAHAWCGGLLAPLGWLALAAVDGETVARCLRELQDGAEAEPTQQRYFGLTPEAVARRLNRRWRLPTWLANISGQLGLPVAAAQQLGADGELFQIVQLAVLLVEQAGTGLGLPVGASLAELRQQLELADLDLPAWAETVLQEVAVPSSWEAPATQPLLRDLLHLAAGQRRQADLPNVERLHHEIDILTGTLREQLLTEEQRLRERKLTALAELAAGAGHEINNPLAVISGQAQYLLNREAEPERRQSLQKIIAQTQRIHHILTDLMQFARPAPPQQKLVDVAALLREVALTLQPLAAERQVRLVCREPTMPLTLYADAGQLARALTYLLRNAIEAAPPEGWAGIRVAAPTPTLLQLLVEDSGRGPSELDREHLFDPFYCGRKAGRGRGLGLPTAWRIAQQHGGGVHFAGTEPTCFILSLPLTPMSATALPHLSAQQAIPA